MLGCETETLIGRNLREIAVDAAEAERFLDEMRKGAVSCIRLNGGGGDATFEAHGGAARTASGRRHVLAVGIDATAARSGAARAAAFERLAAAAAFDGDGRLMHATEQFAALFEERQEALLGRRYDALYGVSGDRLSFERIMVRVRKEETVEDRRELATGTGAATRVIRVRSRVLEGGADTLLDVVEDVTCAEREAVTGRYKGAAFEGSASAMMMVDRDLIVTLANPATMELLHRHEASFRTIWPDFGAGRIIGSCIDRFHRNPAYQRRILADPSRLPFRTDITVGEAKFALSASAVLSADGKIAGNVLEWADVTKARTDASLIAALNRSQAVIEFTMDGKVVNANDNFLAVMGYSLNDIRGRHHRIFVDADYAASAEYSAFWDKLSRGDFDAGKYRRVAKGGKGVWIQAAYNPVLDADGKPFKVLKFATDITREEDGRLAAEETRKRRETE